MKTSTTTIGPLALALASASLLSLLPTAAHGISLHKRDDGPPRVVAMQYERRRVVKPRQPSDSLEARDDTVEASLRNMQTLYFANVSLGTPPQNFELQIDTGSSDLWVNTDQSRFCRSRQDPCAVSGTYNANDSSTYEYVGSWFEIQYADGSAATGDYATDTLRMGGAEVDDFQFGIGYQSSAQQSILGIGYKGLEAQVQNADMDPYDNLPARMVAEGLIQSNAYSLWLNALDASSGSVLFGGVDTERFTGELSTLPIQTAKGTDPNQFLITLTGVSMGGEDLGADDMRQAVLLDSGSSLTYLPNDIVENLYDFVEAEFSPDDGVALVPCELGDDDGLEMTFTFSGPQIKVPISELVLTGGKVTSPPGQNPGDNGDFDGGDGGGGSSQSACIFGVAPAGKGTIVLGDTFLRSAYVVYDLDKNEIAIAQTVFNTTKSNVVEIGSDGELPDASGVSNPATASSLPGGGTPDNSNDNAAAGQKPAMGAVLGVAGAAVAMGMLFV